MCSFSVFSQNKVGVKQPPHPPTVPFHTCQDFFIIAICFIHNHKMHCLCLLYNRLSGPSFITTSILRCSVYKIWMAKTSWGTIHWNMPYEADASNSVASAQGMAIFDSHQYLVQLLVFVSSQRRWAVLYS
jgi:hypothetical protein